MSLPRKNESPPQKLVSAVEMSQLRKKSTFVEMKLLRKKLVSSVETIDPRRNEPPQ